MNDLKKYAGLLNDLAPKNHLLAYITPQERDMLVDAGGVKTPTPSGIFAYPPESSGDNDGGQGGYDSSSNQSGRTSSTSGAGGGSGYSGGGGSGGREDRDSQYTGGGYDSSKNVSGRETGFTYGAGSPTVPENNDNYQDRIQRISTGVEPGFRPQDEQPFGLSKEEAYRQGRITKDQLEAPATLQSQVIDERSPFQRGFDNTLDFFKDGGILGSLLRGFSPMSEALQQKAMTFSLNKRLSNIYKDNPDFEDYESVSEIPGEIGSKVQDLESDLQGVRDGTFKQSDFTAKYGSGDTTNPLDASFDPNSLTRGEQQDLQNLFTPELAYSVSGQTPQSSMVNQYFNNMNMTQGSSLSSDLQTDYNNAKNSVNNILGITPPSQQFGYSAQPYGLLSSTNMADNPYNIDYLKQRGLI